MDLFTYRGGRLFGEGVDLADLAGRVGTPAYVYSRGTLEAHYDRIAAAFAELDPLICYSVKSCGNLAVCRVLVERGAGMDVVSGGELERAFLAGCPMSKVVYAGVGKTDAEIRAALDGRWSLLDGQGSGVGGQESGVRGQESGVRGQESGVRGREAGADHPSSFILHPSPSVLHPSPPVLHPSPSARGPIGWFNIESEQEFEVIAATARQLGVRTRAALRVNPDVDPRTHAYTTTGKKETKFGVDLERALAFFERAGRDEFLRLDALHIHLGSPIYAPGPYVEGIGKVLGLIDELERRGHAVTAIDLGGGFGADYETGRSPGAADYAAEIVPLLRGRAQRGTRIILEPGRTISANAGVLLTRVLYVKRGGSKTFVITDAGMHTLIRPALYGSFHFIWPAAAGEGRVPARREERPDLPGLAPCDIVGPICETGDFLARDRPLPPVQRGDVLAVFTAGAYGMAMASTYNSQPLPCEVMVCGSEWRVVRQRQRVADLVAAETVAPPG